MRIPKRAALAAALFFFAACGRYAGCNRTAGPPRIELNTSAERPTVDVVDVAGAQLSSLAAIGSRDVWTQVFAVKVAADAAPMLGDYRIEANRVRFIPMFPLDPGRLYQVSFTPAGAVPLSATVGIPATHTTPSTLVAQVFPSGDVVPENQLRIYMYFSAPMGSKGGLDYIHLLDDQGKQVVDPFLPLDAEFWNDDRTRYTVFFDPGRQKRGIPVIVDMGRSLTEGKSYTLVVDADWRDGNGQPLKETYRRTFKVGPPDERPLDHTAWQIQAPAVGTRAPLTVAFPESLDHGLLLRALGVQGADGKAVGGDINVTEDERKWLFTPREMWTPGTHHLVAFAMLEDLAGNRIGRAFEVDQFDRSDKSAEPEKTLIPFEIR